MKYLLEYNFSLLCPRLNVSAYSWWFYWCKWKENECTPKDKLLPGLQQIPQTPASHPAPEILTALLKIKPHKQTENGVENYFKARRKSTCMCVYMRPNEVIQTEAFLCRMRLLVRKQASLHKTAACWIGSRLKNWVEQTANELFYLFNLESSLSAEVTSSYLADLCCWTLIRSHLLANIDSRLQNYHITQVSVSLTHTFTQPSCWNILSYDLRLYTRFMWNS